MNNCKTCNVEMLEDENSMFICPKCGQFFFPLVNSYGDDIALFLTSNKQIVYIRTNHFKETINEVVGLQTKRVPPDIFDFIKTNFQPRKKVFSNILSMRDFLKKHKLNCYIKITNNILVNLKLITPPPLPINVFETLVLKFNDLEEKFVSMDTDRKNLLPNNYILFRFFKELNLPEYLPYINLSKNTKLLSKYNTIYEKLI